jgi:hypothetical protein
VYASCFEYVVKMLGDSILYLQYCCYCFWSDK